MFWPTRARVTQTRSRRLTGNFVEEAITQTTDTVSGFESDPFRLGITKTKQQSWRIDFVESQVDPPGVCYNRRFVSKRVPESAIWISCLWPRNTGMVT